MRHVPIAELKNKASEIVAAAEAGEDVIITRHGREILRLIPVETDRMERQKRAIEAMLRTREKLRKQGVRISAAEIQAWKAEGRR